MAFGVSISVYILFNGRSFLFAVLILCHCKMWIGFVLSELVRSWLLAVVLHDKDPSKEFVNLVSYVMYVPLLTYFDTSFSEIFIVCSIQLKSSWYIWYDSVLVIEWIYKM